MSLDLPLSSKIEDALAKLSKILGPKGFTKSVQTMEPWLTDWRGRYSGKALAMLSPNNTSQVSEIMKIANHFGLPIVPQGGNSGMSGGATPDRSGSSLLLSLRRMDSIGSVKNNDQLITCQAGVILQNLHDAADALQLRFPLTLGGKGSATVGGLVSTNAGGTQVLRHGNMRALVAGVEAVLADGSVYNGLVPLKKDNRGYDLDQLLIGSEGTLAIITAATLQLVPAITDRTVCWVGLNSPNQASALFTFLDQISGSQIEAFEIIQNHCLGSVLRHFSASTPPLEGDHKWHVLIEYVHAQDDSNETTDNSFERATKDLANAFEHQLMEDAVISTSNMQIESFWRIRDSISEAERKSGPAIQHDISVPVLSMAEFIPMAIEKVEKKFAGCKAIAFGHLGDGNVHFHVKAPANLTIDQWQHDDIKAISEYVHDLVMEQGGSISAEHGIGQMKLEELARTSEPARLQMMRAIKSALDPNGILNPGKLVPLASESSAT